MTLKQAWKIWIIPAGLYWILTIVFWLAFNRVLSTVPKDSYIVDIVEGIITLVLGGMLLAFWYVIMLQYERIIKLPVRTQTRVYWRFFVIVYIVAFFVIVVSILTGDLPSLK